MVTIPSTSSASISGTTIPDLEQTTKTIKFKRGIEVQWPDPFSADDYLAAQRSALKAKDAGLTPLYLLQKIATFNGGKLTVPEIKAKLSGSELMKLQGEILTGLDDEDDASGN